MESKHTTDYRTSLIELYAAAVNYSIRYKLDGPGIESQWQRDLLHPSRPALGPTSLLYNVYRVSFQGVKRPGIGHTHHHIEPRLRKEYSYTSIHLLGLYGLL